MKKIFSLFCFLVCLMQTNLESTQIPGAIILMNDSPYILTATVYANNGQYLGQITLQPGEQQNFTTNLYSIQLSRPGNSEVSLTPYRIIWTCSNGEVYSMCRDGAVGSLVRANECPGQLYCQPPKEQAPNAK